MEKRVSSSVPQVPGLTTTALVHETYLKLIAVDRIRWEDRAHFMALAATTMRHVLMNYARRNRAAKRGSGRRRLSLDQAPIFTDTGADQLVALDDALHRLAELNERLSRTVELRYFGGLSIEETAAVLEISTPTVKREWSMAKVWLRQQMKR